MPSDNNKTATIYREGLHPRVDFEKDDFDNLVTTKGYVCLLSRATFCPCLKVTTSHAINHCQSCNGFGWIYSEPVEMSGVIQSVNLSKNYGQRWSELLVGTSLFTARSEHHIGYYDRVMVKDSVSLFSQVLTNDLPDITIGAITFKRFRTTYNTAFEILDLYHYDTANNQANPIDFSDGDIVYLEDGVLHVDESLITDPEGAVSITYKHMPIYLVIEHLHNFRNSYALTDRERHIPMPQQVVLKLLHFIEP